MRAFRDTRATTFDCADVLFEVNDTSAQCCVAVKQTWSRGVHARVMGFPLEWDSHWNGNWI